MQPLKTIAFWLFAFLAIGPVLATPLVASGHAPSFPVFLTFAEAPSLWHAAFFVSGLLAITTAFLLRRNNKLAALSALAFAALYIPSYSVVWGQVALGVWLATVATVLTLASLFFTSRGV